MLKKIYVLFAVLSAIAVGVSLWYGQSWLGSIGDPRTAYANYGFQNGLALSILWLSSIVMLLLSHGILWSAGSGWAFWTTFVYFSIFTVIDTFILSPVATEFRVKNFAAEESFPFGFLIGAGLITLFGLIVLGNQFFSLRVREWMYPPKAAETAESDTEAAIHDE